MDCNTARVYLQFDGNHAAELQQHLGECSACNHLSQDLQRLDLQLGRAMRAVEVPRNLKQQILDRLSTETVLRRRPMLSYALVVGGIAAALLLSWGLFVLYGTGKPVIYGDGVVRDFNILGRDEDTSNLQLRQLSANGRAPSFVNYAYLCGVPSLAVLPGTQFDRHPVRVPQLFFARGDQRAVIYVVPKSQYVVEDVQGHDPAYPWQLQIEEDEENLGFVYLVFHTGKDWRWLRASSRN